ncbi:MAG TPA: biotin--[acetyl-CoA-carboxylase] ligase [Alcanivorax sp.]|nr:biotin--[acetyl-CoA-carboxylase] ligase [Alcanivorax sp.]
MRDSDPDQHLIRLLADGRFHSGAALGEALGVSRAAIWKRLQRVADVYGLSVESVRGKGYRLSKALDPLDPAALEQALGGRAGLHFQAVTGSTNADAMALAANASGPMVVTTEYQSAGRGRRGRQWRSPFGANLYLSVLYRLSGGFSSLGGLSLAAGVAVSRALADTAPDSGLGLKWPNDVLVNGAKLGGVLIELAGEMEGQVQVVVGVGINVSMSDHQAEGIDQEWTDLRRISGAPPGRTRLAAAVADELLTMLDRFAVEGFAPFVAAFDRIDVCRDRPVVVHTGAGQRTGIARGVSEDGALRVEIDGETHYMHGGEVSLRLQ